MHFNHQPFRLQRTFVIQNQETNKTKVIPFQIFTFTDQFDLFPVLSYALEQIKNVSINIYDFRINRYVDIQTLGIRFHVPMHIFDNGNHVVLMKYHSIQSQTLSLNSIGSSLFQDNKSETRSKKTQRSKQRVILEVIQIVRKWRKLCDSKKGTTLTLAEAAATIGMPKKSLDDYYYQLRMGQKYGFDYHAHMMQRIGVLRSFLKKYKTHRKGDKNQKLPNVLKIADQIEGYDNLVKQNAQYINQDNEINIDEQKPSYESDQGIKKQSIQKQFYNEFNYNFGKQMDPFLSLGKGPIDHRMNQQSNISNEFDMYF